MAQELATTFEAVYENGALKPTRKLDLTEGQKVRLRLAEVISEEEFLERNPCFAPDPLADGPTDLSETVDQTLYAFRRESDD